MKIFWVSKLTLVMFILVFYATNHASDIVLNRTFDIPEQLKKEIGAGLVQKVKFEDRLGVHILILTRTEKNEADETVVIKLKAQQFLVKNEKFIREWEINDGINCRGLDVEGDFVLNLTSVTDLDLNKQYESSVSYCMICTGGIEPKTVKTILRQGNEKFAARGVSLIDNGDGTKSGGKVTLDKISNGKNEIKLFLMKMWNSAAGVK